MPTNGSSIGIKKYVPAVPAVKRGIKKKKAPKPEGSKGGGDSSYFQMLQILSTPTVRKGQSTIDAGMAGLAKGLALAQLLKGAVGGSKGGKVSGGTVLEKTKPTSSPLATKKKTTGFAGFGGVG